MSVQKQTQTAQSVVYRGERIGPADVRVFRSGGLLLLAPSLAVRNHSPTGFEWGYAGSAPAQLALALLLDVTGDPGLSEDLHQDFKREFVASWPEEGWAISSETIRDWVARRPTAAGE